MLRTRWYKVLADLWRHRGRTLIVALAVAVGVYAVGVVVNVREILVREYLGNQARTYPASAILHTQPFDDGLAERIAEIPGVAAAEGRREVRTRLYTAGGAVRDLVLVAIPDFGSMRVDAITRLEGAWPPGKREVLLERMSPAYLDAGAGNRITAELEDGLARTLTVVGTAYDAQQLGPDITDKAYGYVTPETMDSLGFDENYTELRIRVIEPSRDEAHIRAVLVAVEDQLEQTGREVLSTRIITHSEVGPYIDTIVLILSTFGIIILLLSGFLVVNAISALITQQVPQIGIMKLVGARRWQIMSLYVVTVLVYGLIAVAIGIPLALLTARLVMSELVDGLLNIMSTSYAVSPPVITLQVITGLMLPLLAGLSPVLKGTRITTHRALSGVGMQTAAPEVGLVERLLAQLQRIRAVRRPLLLALRNTLRHKMRLAQTLLVLIVGTALFISVLSVWSSVNATLQDFMRYHQYDVSIGLDRPYRIARLEGIAGQVRGVEAVEAWSVGSAIRIRPDETESDGIRVYAVPTNSAFLDPKLLEGTWLQPEGPAGSEPGAGSSTGAIVVNTDVLVDEADLRLGDDVVLEIDGREAAWHITGIVPTESRGPALYMAREDYATVNRMPGQATHVQVLARWHDDSASPGARAAVQQELEIALRERFEAQGFGVLETQTTEGINASNELAFTVVVAFLVLMALLLAAVGGLGLTTTMSINILERVREIGVLRAIGASNISVRRIVLAEGIAMGMLSWAAGMILSLPISALMSDQVGLALIDVPLRYQYSVPAAVLWFFALLAVAVVASLGPARKAVRLTIREVLAYE